MDEEFGRSGVVARWVGGSGEVTWSNRESAVVVGAADAAPPLDDRPGAGLAWRATHVLSPWVTRCQRTVVVLYRL